MLQKMYKCKNCERKWEARAPVASRCPNCNGVRVMLIQLGPKIKKYTCAKCGHEWRPRIKDPRLCPSCRTAYWQEETRDDEGKIIHMKGF